LPATDTKWTETMDISPSPDPVKSPLSDPIEWRLWKNRRRIDAIVVSLSEFENRTIFSVRQYTTSPSGKMLPTTKGVAMVIARLPELAKAVEKALAKARELHLLPDDQAGGST
jgi:Transcriptional Coactivator p15 (PC4)